LAGEESTVERSRPRFQFEAQGLLLSDAGGGGDEPPRVDLGFKVQAGLPTLLVASLQPSVVSFGDGFP
jgi:hypothetical protein